MADNTTGTIPDIDNDPDWHELTTGLTAKNGDVPGWLIPDRLYDVLKWLGLIALPVLAVFVSTVGPAWGWPATGAIVVTLNALGALCGGLIGLSEIKARMA